MTLKGYDTFLVSYNFPSHLFQIPTKNVFKLSTLLLTSFLSAYFFNELTTDGLNFQRTLTI
jgi:hypothetical protein